MHTGLPSPLSVSSAEMETWCAADDKAGSGSSSDGPSPQLTSEHLSPISRSFRSTTWRSVGPGAGGGAHGRFSTGLLGLDRCRGAPPTPAPAGGGMPMPMPALSGGIGGSWIPPGSGPVEKVNHCGWPSLVLLSPGAGAAPWVGGWGTKGGRGRPSRRSKVVRTASCKIVSSSRKPLLSVRGGGGGGGGGGAAAAWGPWGSVEAAGAALALGACAPPLFGGAAPPLRPG